ncbi:MAG: hypothetical protein ACKOXF_07415, partial [Chitinophagaceae bacterium]
QAAQTIELIKIKTGEVKKETSSDKYSYSETSDHFYMLIVPKTTDMTALKLSFLNYNKSFYAEEGLRVTTSLLGDQFQILIVNNFKSLDKGKAYIKDMSSNAKFFTDAKIEDSTKQYLISKENFGILITDKVLEDYTSFFKSKYNY